MDLPNTTHPHLVSIGQSLSRSLQRHVVQNDLVQAAFADLAFEMQLARHVGTLDNGAVVLESSA